MAPTLTASSTEVLAGLEALELVQLSDAERHGFDPAFRAHFGRCPTLASASQVGGQLILGVTPGATPLRHKRAAVRPRPAAQRHSRRRASF
jgi:hypothetical protein